MDIYRQVQTSYDRMVPEFAKRHHFNIPDHLVALAKELAEHVGPQGRLIDIGCGTGRDMAWFEAQHIPTLGVDLSMGMLAYARENVRGELVSMNMRYLGFANACFDGAWCCASLLHLPKAEAIYALGEIRRILKVGAMLMLCVQEGTGEGWEESYIPDASRFFARYQESEMIDLLLKNGFRVLKTNLFQAPGRTWLSLVCVAE